jgi:outer membrane lipoprotein-sorting protein
MNRLSLALAVMFTVATLLVAGCGGGGETTPAPTATPTASATPVATQPSAALSDLLGRISVVQSVKFRMVTTGPGSPEGTTSDVWQKDGRRKAETEVIGWGVSTYTDYDARKMCVCFEATGTCTSEDFSKAPADPVEQAGIIEQYHPAILGSETRDGKDCLAIEWTAEGADTRWWVDKDTGWPVRVETTTSEGTTVIEYADVEFVDIPDSEIAFPAECE